MTGLVQKNFVFQGKEKISVVGRIGMQLSMIDITGRDLRPGDEVSVPMRRTTSSARLPRIFLKNQAVWKIC